MKKPLVYISLGALLLGAICASTGVTLAAYLSREKITQETGYQGEISKYSIFLDVAYRRPSDNFSWSDADAVFYMYCYDSANPSNNTWVDHSTQVTPTINGKATNMYVFRFDKSKYTHYSFVRFNPNGTFPGWGEDSVWNRTASIPFNNYTYNYYGINGAQTPNGDGYGNTTDDANWGTLTYNSGTGAWSLVYPS